MTSAYVIRWLRAPHCAQARPVVAGAQLRPWRTHGRDQQLTETVWVCRHDATP